MSSVSAGDARTSTVFSEDGTPIAFHSVGRGPGLIIVGGVLSSGSAYLALAAALADRFEVHVMERRGRPGSGQQRPDHDIGDECADLCAVAEATGSTAVFGHSFGGLVVLETVLRRPVFDELMVYDPGVPLRGALTPGWLEGYRQRLERGDRRGAFAWMVKQAGFAPAALRLLPLWCVRPILGMAIRGPKWDTMDQLLEANLVEHRVQAELDAPTLDRFTAITVPTLLLAGAKSPDVIGAGLVHELAEVIPNSSVKLLPGLGHTAPEDSPDQIAAAINGAQRGADLTPDA